MLRRMFRSTNGQARLLVGMFIAGLFCVQCSRTQAVPDLQLVSALAGRPQGQDAALISRLEHLARSDHAALLELCLKNYDLAYRDYRCTFVKQERLGGKLGDPQVIKVKFTDKPFSVAMDWLENKPIADRLIYVEGKYNNQMLVKPRGFLASLVGTVLRPPDGEEAMKNTLRPVNLFGFHRSMQALLDVYRQASSNGDLRQEFGQYAEVAGRKALVLLRHLPPKHDYPAEKTVTYVDLEYLVPVCIEGYDWDGQLCSRYVYKDVKFNVGLTADDFLPEANGMPPLK